MQGLWALPVRAARRTLRYDGSAYTNGAYDAAYFWSTLQPWSPTP